jgi:glycosyltransferase involved in cell wall biosynthesis
MITPLVSVKTITYNHEDFIEQCIEGVLMQQTNFRFEFVIGEDCSTDSTLDIVQDYASKYPEIIRVITSESNVGAGENDRRTNEACRGKYVAFCEGDDFWTDPLKLQKQVDFLESHSEYGMVHSSFSGKIGDRIEKDIWKNKTIPEGWVLEELIKGNFIATATVCVRNELLREINISQLIAKKKWIMGDYPLWLEVAAKSKIGYIPDDMTTYRVHANSATHGLNMEGQYKFFIDRYAIKRYFAEKYQEVHLVNDLEEMYHKELLKYSIFLKRKELRGKCLRFFRVSFRYQLSFWYIFSRFPVLDPLFVFIYFVKKKILLRESL